MPRHSFEYPAHVLHQIRALPVISVLLSKSCPPKNLLRHSNLFIFLHASVTLIAFDLSYHLLLRAFPLLFDKLPYLWFLSTVFNFLHNFPAFHFLMKQSRVLNCRTCVCLMSRASCATIYTNSALASLAPSFANLSALSFPEVTNCSCYVILFLCRVRSNPPNQKIPLSLSIL